MATRKALGRGLSALLSGGGDPVDPAEIPVTLRIPGDQLLDIDIDLVDPNPAQPRTAFNDEKLAELAQSIRSNGLVQPILVRRGEAGRYQIVAGERRWRASQRAGLRKIKAVVRNIEDQNLLELALVENIQRQELNPIEEAQAYQRLVTDLGMTHEDVAQKVGKDRSSVANFIRLLKLSPDVQRLVAEDKLSMGHARALLGLESEEQQRALAREVGKRQLSVRQTEQEVKRLAGGRREVAASTPIKNDANIRAAELKLKRKLGAPVRIQLHQQGGKIEIDFGSVEDLDRIYSVIMEKTEHSSSHSDNTQSLI
ncbi:MAG: ParB/RepB/Spo0J family partition protein [Blastocatellia bacterium]